MKKLLFCVTFVLVLLVCNGQIGELDPTFGKNGIVTANLGSNYNYSYKNQQALLQSDGSILLITEIPGQTIISKKSQNGTTDSMYGFNGSSLPIPINNPHGVIQNDGKIVIVGYTQNFFRRGADFEIARFKTDGHLDSTFGVNGTIITGFKIYNTGNAIAIQGDGKLVVCGSSFSNGADQTIELARFNTDGTVDYNFGNGGSQSFGYHVYPTCIAIQSDDKILIGGSQLWRCTSNGFVDSTFNSNGQQSISGTKQIVVQNDGRILLLQDGGVAIYRLKPNGVFDSSFASNGILTSDFGGSNDQANALLIQQDGKIVVGGSAVINSTSNFALARYKVNGILDNSFSQNGRQITSIGTSSAANSVILQSDGKLLAFGTSQEGNTNNIAATRYNTNGSQDRSFGTDGIWIDNIHQSSTFFSCTAIKSDGKIVTGGFTWNGLDYDFALARYNKDGKLDNTFGNSGKQITDFGTTDDRVSAIAIQADGKIVIAGVSGGKFGLARYNINGSLDLTFDNDGIQTTAFASPVYVSSLLLQNDGKIVVGGSVIARYNINGSPDLSFDTVGYINTSFSLGAIGLQPDGKIVAVGDYTAARYTTDGKADSTFGTNGISNLYYYFYSTGSFNGRSIEVQKDGKILLAGSNENYQKSGTTSHTVLMRLNTDGTYDNTFNSGFPVVSSVNYLDYATSLIVQGDDKIILGGYYINSNNENFSITRYNPNGSVDNTFSGNGSQTSPISGTNDLITALAIAEDKLYAVGYGQFPANLGIVARYLLGPEAGPLPVSLVDFTATAENKIVRLRWQTSSEHNLSNFIIQRSGDTQNFTSIGYLNANGNTNFKTNYTTLDNSPLNDINYYRLKMMDIDGKFSFSKIVSVKLKDDGFNFTLSPNPAQDILHVNINGVHETVTLQIVDANGKKVKEMKSVLNGSTSLSIDIHNLSRGVYSLKLFKTSKNEIIRFIKE